MADRILELKRQGNRALVGRRYDEALERFDQLIIQFPDAREGFIGKAKTLDRLRRFGEIVELLSPRAKTLNSAQVYRLLGDACRVLVNRGRSSYLEGALSAYRAYHELRVDPVTLYYEADLLFSKVKSVEKALASYRASWDADPTSREAYQGVLKCLNALGRTGELKEVKRLWKQRTS